MIFGSVALPRVVATRFRLASGGFWIARLPGARQHEVGGGGVVGERRAIPAFQLPDAGPEQFGVKTVVENPDHEAVPSAVAVRVERGQQAGLALVGVAGIGFMNGKTRGDAGIEGRGGIPGRHCAPRLAP